MNSNIGIIVFLVFILNSCDVTETRDIHLEAINPENSYFEIQNNGERTAVFSFENNNLGVYDMNKIVSFINFHYQNMPIAEKVWRFIVEFTKHKHIITKNNWLYNPLLTINSAGGSLCGFRSAAMTNILVYMGIKARSWCINGHVISEVYVDGRWQVYDPDLGVVYYNKKGNICSFFELTNNPRYITNPYKVLCISSYCDSITACSEKTSEMYSSKNDNSLFNTSYIPFEKSQKILFMMPKGSTLMFPIPDNSENTSFALAELKLPKDWIGKVKMSLIPFNYSGEAEIEYKNKTMTPDFENWSQEVSNSIKFEDEIIVKKNPKGLVIRYYINPYIYCPKKSNSIQLIGKGVVSLEVNCKKYNISQQPNWIDICNEEYINWLKNIALIPEIDKKKVKNAEDYFVKINELDKHGAFNKYNVDAKLFYEQLKIEVNKFKNRDTEFWKQFEDENNFVHSFMIVLKEINYVSK